MTDEQYKISRHNHRIAVKYFNLQKGLVLHHINPEWRHNDIERYIQWNPEDLVVMTKSEHRKLHASGLPSNRLGAHCSEETKTKISKSIKGIKRSDEFCKHLSEMLIGNTNTKGKRWYNNGVKSIMAFTCPDGYTPGRLKWKG